MEGGFDPNVPDTSNGDFFCRLCLVSANSENMWISHVAGRRHIKNVAKFPNGLPSEQSEDYYEGSSEKPDKYRSSVEQYDEDYEDSSEKSANYGRYKDNDKWDGYSSSEYDLSRKGYISKIRPQVIDYEHKTCPPEEILPSSSKILDADPVREKQENLIEKIFDNKCGDRLKKSFEEKYSKRQVDEILLSKLIGSNLKESRKETLYDDDFKKELDDLLKKNVSKEFQLGVLPKISFNKPGSKNKDIFCEDECRKQILDILQGRSVAKESKDKDLDIFNFVSKKDVSHEIFDKRQTADHSLIMKRRDDRSEKLDRDFNKKIKRKRDEEDFVDIFHRMNDKKIFKMSKAEECSVQKSSNTSNSKLDNIDPDKLTPDLVDSILSSFLKPKAGSSKEEDLAEIYKKNSVEKEVKEDDPDSLVKKLLSLPTKTFFQTVMTTLKKVELKDFDELSMLLDVISEVQAVVYKKLPPHLQTVIKPKMPKKPSNRIPVPVQNPQFPLSSTVPTTLPSVPQSVSQPVLQTASRPVLKYGSQPVTRRGTEPVSQSISHMVPVQAPESYPTSQAKPSQLNTSDSYKNMVAWQNYFAKSEASSTESTQNVSNSIQAMIAYQRYISDMQTNTGENFASLNTPFNSKTTLPTLPDCTTVASAVPQMSSLSASKTVSQTLSSKTALRHAQSHNSTRKSKYEPQANLQTTSSKIESPSNPASVLNQTDLQNYQAYYQQMYAIHLNGLNVPSGNFNSLPNASRASLRQNLVASKSNVPFWSNSQSSGKK